MHNLHKKLAKLSVIAAVFVSCTSDFDDIPSYEKFREELKVGYCIWIINGERKCNPIAEVGEEFCNDFGKIVKEQDPDYSNELCQPKPSSSSATPSSSSGGGTWTGYCEAEVPGMGLMCFPSSEEECFEWTDAKAVEEEDCN
jgi:hypothetical protein